MQDREQKDGLLLISENRDGDAFFRMPEIESSFYLHRCGKQENILDILRKNQIRVVLLELEDDEEWVLKLLKVIKTFDALIDVIILGPPVNSELVMFWINQGATDYLTKPFHSFSGRRVLERLEQKRKLMRDTYLLEKKLDRKYIFQGMVSRSPFMLEVFSLIENIAPYFTTVLITGETGTGKEMVARAIHSLSGVKNRKYVVCDCASLPENLVESELFGYVRGAFTGAERDKRGLFDEAHEGIIFLDEIGELPFSLQAKLLRVVESRHFRPLGGSAERSVDVRIMAATSKNLKEEVKKGSFREDLYHRLNKVEIHLIPLRSRKEDIPLLVRYFLERYNRKFRKKIRGVSRRVHKAFLAYDWPGNVRELENVLESSSMLCRRDFIDVTDLPKYLQQYMAVGENLFFFDSGKLYTLEELEKRYINFLLKKTQKNMSRTAKILNIARSTLYEKLKKYEIDIVRSQN